MEKSRVEVLPDLDVDDVEVVAAGLVGELFDLFSDRSAERDTQHTGVESSTIERFPAAPDEHGGSKETNWRP